MRSKTRHEFTKTAQYKLFCNEVLQKNYYAHLTVLHNANLKKNKVR